MSIKKAYLSILLEETYPKILHNGKLVHTTNSNGQRIHQADDGIRKFHDWFGDNGVKDEHGRPMVLYHGSKSKENLPRLIPGGDGNTETTGDAFGLGVYATTSRHTASTYTNGEGAVYPIYAKGNFIQLTDEELPKPTQDKLTKFANDKIIDADKAVFDSAWDTTEFKKSELDRAKDFMDERIKDHEHFGGIYDRTFPRIEEHENKFIIHHMNYNKPVSIKTGNDVHKLATRIGYDSIKDAGIDGVIMNRAGGEKWLVSHNSNFKSVIGNSGKFSGETLHEGLT